MRELTIKEVRNFGYQHPELVKKYDEEQLVRQANAIRYIDHLAGITNTDVSDVKLHNFMNHNENLHVERTEINKIFFQLKEKIGSIPEAPPAIPKAKLLEIDKKITDHMKLMLREQDHQVRKIRDEATRQWKRAQVKSRELLKASIDKMNMEKCYQKGVDLTPMVERLLNSSRFWSLAEHGFAFNTKTISLSYYNEAQDAENVVNLGRFRAEIQFKEGLQVKVLPFENNVKAGEGGRMYHPHVNAEGLVCYGNYLDSARIHGDALDLYSLMDLVRSVLSNFNDDNPYLRLYSFQSAREGTDRALAMASATPQQLEDLGIDLESDSNYVEYEPEEQESED